MAGRWSWMLGLGLAAGVAAAEERPQPEQFWALADVGIVLTLRAAELRFTTVPDLTVRLPLGRGAAGLDATWRHNFPEDPEAGVVYRDIRYQRVIAARLSPEEWDLIIADELANEGRR